jgi:hypothetical protein
MPALQRILCERLFAHDIWAEFTPARPSGDVQGWNGDHPVLPRVVSEYPAPIVIDVGAWKGQATIAMASEMRRCDVDGCVIAVDTFLGSADQWDLPLFTRRAGFPDLYETFMSNVHHAGLADYVVPLPQAPAAAAEILRSIDVRATVVHLDASRTYSEVLRDAEEFWTVLVSGGTLIGDDYDQTWPGVVRAAGEFSASHRVPLTIEYPKWIAVKA